MSEQRSHRQHRCVSGGSPFGLAVVQRGVVEAHAAAREGGALLLQEHLVARAAAAVGLAVAAAAADVERVDRRRRRPRARSAVQRHVLRNIRKKIPLSGQPCSIPSDMYFMPSSQNTPAYLPCLILQ